MNGIEVPNDAERKGCVQSNSEEDKNTKQTNEHELDFANIYRSKELAASEDGFTDNPLIESSCEDDDCRIPPTHESDLDLVESNKKMKCKIEDQRINIERLLSENKRMRDEIERLTQVNNDRKMPPTHESDLDLVESNQKMKCEDEMCI